MAEAVPLFQADPVLLADFDALEARYAWVAVEVYAREKAEAAQRAADYATSIAWTERLGPYEIVGRYRLPTTNPEAWTYYSHGVWYPIAFEQVVAHLQADTSPGTTPGFYNRATGLSTYIADPLAPERLVPNPVFLVPSMILPSWELPR